MAEDRIYSVPLNCVGDFAFDEAVADVFPDMIRRSVPGYASMLSMIAQTASRYSVAGSNLYDLGCSLGAGTMLLRQNAALGCCIHAVDSSVAMVSRLQERVGTATAGGSEIRIEQADIRDVCISNASVVVLNLTLQFLPPQDRTSLIFRIADGMRDGGALVLSVKVRFDDAAQQQLMTELHHEFKRAHGYSELEIAQKRTAIENQLIPESLATHLERLQRAGFRSVAPWFQCFNFASILAIK